MLKLAFKPSWLAFLALMLVLASAFVGLSKWQLEAAKAGQLHMDPAKEVVRPYGQVLAEHEPLLVSEADTMVELTGHYRAASSYLVANKFKDGQSGCWVVSLFIPDDAPQVSDERGSGPRAVAVARGWTSEAELPEEPQGSIVLAGRVIANDPPYFSYQLDRAAAGGQQALVGSLLTAQLTNLWDTALFAAPVVVDQEHPLARGLELTAEGRLAGGAALMGDSSALQPIGTEQVVDEELDWLNIFYALEWLVFAAFALYLWWRMLKDAYQKKEDPAQYFEYEGQYWLDEASGRYYYWDPQDKKYYFFDEILP